MSSIHFTRDHGLGLDLARRRVDDVARRLEREFQVACQWRGNRLLFKRPGASGSIDVTESLVTLDVRLGLLLAPMRQAIADRIADRLTAVLAAP